jgi:hypothetical protein
MLLHLINVDEVTPIDCILHIGIGKAGSSTIQAALETARADLARQGVLYPDDLLSGGRRGGDNHKCLAVSCMDSTSSNIVLQQHGIASLTARRKFDVAVRGLYRAQVTNSDARVCLLSAEHFWSCLTSPAEIARLASSCASIGARIAKVIIYIRRQSDWLESIQHQRLREARELLPLSADALLANPLVRHIDYQQVLAKWQQGFPDAVVCPRLFDRTAFKNGDLLSDFLDATGLEVTLPPQPSKNVSALSNAGINAMVHLNRAIPLLREQGGLNRERNGLVEFVANSLAGECTILSPETKTAIDARFAESNEAVRQNYFPSRAQLFATGQKAAAKESFSPITDPDFHSVVAMLATLWQSGPAESHAVG